MAQNYFENCSELIKGSRTNPLEAHMLSDHKKMPKPSSSQTVDSFGVFFHPQTTLLLVRELHRAFSPIQSTKPHIKTSRDGQIRQFTRYCSQDQISSRSTEFQCPRMADVRWASTPNSAQVVDWYLPVSCPKNRGFIHPLVIPQFPRSSAYTWFHAGKWSLLNRIPWFKYRFILGLIDPGFQTKNTGRFLIKLVL